MSNAKTLTTHQPTESTSLFQQLTRDFMLHKEKRIQQVTGMYMVFDLIGHIINVGLSAFQPTLYVLNIILFTTTIPGQLYNILLFSAYCLHGTNGLTIIVKDYHLGGNWQHLLIRLIRLGGLMMWILGFTYLVTGYLGLGFGVPPIA